MTLAHTIRTALDVTLAGLQEGDPVPAERELAARFGVARETVRQALHELLVAGRIERAAAAPWWHGPSWCTH